MHISIAVSCYYNWYTNITNGIIVDIIYYILKLVVKC